MITLEEVTSKKELQRFIAFPHELYKECNCYIPELNRGAEKLLTSENPFFDHSGASLFIAMEDGKIKGRIAFIENNEHNRVHDQNICFFGFFDVVNDFNVASVLLNKIVLLANELNYDSVAGPTNLTSNDSCGVLVKGFHLDPIIGMPYNFNYYEDFLKQYGFSSEMNLLSYSLSANEVISSCENHCFKTINQRLKTKYITIRESDFSQFKSEMAKLRIIYNESNADNWGFVPLTASEFGMMSSSLKLFIPHDLILFAVREDRIIGFVVAIPDFNFVFKKIRNGKLFPFGFIKLFLFRKKISKARILILGVLKGYRGMGVDMLLYRRITKNLLKMGIAEAEACFVLESNAVMKSILKKLGGVKIKEYSIFSLKISGGT